MGPLQGLPSLPKVKCNLPLGKEGGEATSDNVCPKVGVRKWTQRWQWTNLGDRENVPQFPGATAFKKTPTPRQVCIKTGTTPVAQRLGVLAVPFFLS